MFVNTVRFERFKLGMAASCRVAAWRLVHRQFILWHLARFLIILT